MSDERQVGRREFVAIVAGCQAMAASSIDLMIPAFKDVRAEFGLAPQDNQVSWIVTAFFIGIATGQLVFGPISDRFGRKRVLYAGLGIMMFGAAASALARSLPLIYAFRVVWGLGASAPRSLAIAMVRDRFGGEQMARVMGFVMATFMVVPILAPSVGALLIAVFPWRAVFWAPFVFAALLSLWLLRLPETLPPERRRGVGPRAMAEAFGIVVRQRATVAYGLATCCLFSTMASFIGNLELIIGDVYDRDRWYPILFGALGVILAIGSLVSARIVVRVGLEPMIRRGAIALLISTALLLTVSLAAGGRPNFALVCACVSGMLLGLSVLNANTNTAAMVPVPHVAGMAAALLGSTATFMGALIASIVNASYDGTMRPFAIGVFSFAVAAFVCVFFLAPDGTAEPRAAGFGRSV